jgi:hypothetical protein
VISLTIIFRDERSEHLLIKVDRVSRPVLPTAYIKYHGSNTGISIWRPACCRSSWFNGETRGETKLTAVMLTDFFKEDALFVTTINASHKRKNLRPTCKLTIVNKLLEIWRSVKGESLIWFFSHTVLEQWVEFASNNMPSKSSVDKSKRKLTRSPASLWKTIPFTFLSSSGLHVTFAMRFFRGGTYSNIVVGHSTKCVRSGAETSVFAEFGGRLCLFWTPSKSLSSLADPSDLQRMSLCERWQYHSIRNVMKTAFSNVRTAVELTGKSISDMYII